MTTCVFISSDPCVKSNMITEEHDFFGKYLLLTWFQREMNVTKGI